MIYYDSRRWATLVRLRGSVIPRALLWALPSAIIAFGIKYFEEIGFYNLHRLEILTQGDVYSGFTYVLGFSLVFRTTQSYTRYWTAATAVHEMASEWSDSCASLVAFASVSHATKSEVDRFKHTVVRLFSLLHAMALAEIAASADDLPILDVQGLCKQQLRVLFSGAAQGRKVQIVLSWIKSYITQMADSGLLNVPPPILTRVFQELGSGLVNFHKAQQVVIFPFPFPYTQLNVLLTQVYVFVTPLVICTWRTWPWVCAVFTFFAVACTMCLDIIAAELENPFGDDPNDLPMAGLQGDMNMFLTMQLNPATTSPPDLDESARMDFRELECNLKGDLSRIANGRRIGASCSSSSTSSPTPGTPKKRNHPPLSARWHGQAASEDEMLRLQRWLHCLSTKEVDSKLLKVEFVRSTSPGQDTEAFQVDTWDVEDADCNMESKMEPQKKEDLGSQTGVNEIPGLKKRPSVYSNGSKAMSPESYVSRPTFCRCNTWGAPADPVVDWDRFLHDLHEEFRHNMENQLEVQQRGLDAIEGMLSRLCDLNQRHLEDIAEEYCDDDSPTSSLALQERQRLPTLPAPLPPPLLMNICAQDLEGRSTPDIPIANFEVPPTRRGEVWQRQPVRTCAHSGRHMIL